MKPLMGLILILSVALSLLAVDAIAQDAAPVEDEVIVEGQVRGGDPAMAAFLSGDYETAEIEFERNFRNINRIEFLRETFFDSARLEAAAAAPIGANSMGSTLQSTSVQSDPGLSSLLIGQRRQKERKNDGIMFSGTDKGYQLYMMGLSQIQLGKYEEARENMARALRLNRTLHDARVRLSLLDWEMTGSSETAQEQLETLQKALKSCRTRCDQLGQRVVLEESVGLLSGLLAEG